MPDLSKHQAQMIVDRIEEALHNGEVCGLPWMESDRADLVDIVLTAAMEEETPKCFRCRAPLFHMGERRYVDERTYCRACFAQSAGLPLTAVYPALLTFEEAHA